MKKYLANKLSVGQLQRLCLRPSLSYKKTLPVVKKICADIKRSSDAGVLYYTKRFDGVDAINLSISQNEIKLACGRIPKKVKAALKVAYNNIRKFHSSEIKSFKRIVTMPGVVCWRELRAIERVGLYVPAGTAPLPSTVLMLGIPAILAGCSEVVLCTPPNRDGQVSDAILYTAKLCGIKKIFKVGGAQAIAAMAYGTETIPKVDKIFGPGNQYVTIAKQIVSVEPGGPAIDMPAGPSEVLVVADGNARVDFIAADLLSQAEHGVDSQAVLVCTSNDMAMEVVKELQKQIINLPRKNFAMSALEKSFILVVGDVSEAIQFANEYAPEHLILNIVQATRYLSKVKNAGSVFVGPFSPESAGDYASGTNHTLPTAGAARAYSGVSLESFMKYVTFQKLTKAGARSLGPTVSVIAGVEGLTAHQRAMEIRYR